MPSHMSEIYEAELVNDGGHKYATFNTLFEEDLEEETFTEPSKFFKKLMHLKPNASQLLFDTSNVDFGNTAASEVSNVSVGDAEDPIWDKTFKIRLTSKKTGKKIDLNITYNLEGDKAASGDLPSSTERAEDPGRGVLDFFPGFGGGP